MVGVLLSLPVEPPSDHAADALAVAVCHASRSNALEAAEAARAGNASISPTEPAEKVTIATGTVDGRVKRVRPGTIEVSDDEGNVYELRIDGRSRGLRRGRHIPLRDITEGTPVRASFDLMGGGESLARDIQLRR